MLPVIFIPGRIVGLRFPFVYTPPQERINLYSPTLFNRISQYTYCQNSRVPAHIIQFPHILLPIPGLINT